MRWLVVVVNHFYCLDDELQRLATNIRGITIIIIDKPPSVTKVFLSGPSRNNLPIILDFRIKVPVVISISKPRWNFTSLMKVSVPSRQSQATARG